MKTAVIVVVLLGGWAAGACAATLEVDFAGHTYDRRLFRAEIGTSGGTWDVLGKGLHGMLPSGKPGRAPLRFVGQLRLEGDFEVTADYVLISLPRPPGVPEGLSDHDVSNNVALCLPGAEQFAIVYRNHRASGEGAGYFAKAAERNPVGKHRPAEGEKGRLGLRRKGSTLFFLLSDAGGELKECGTLAYGTGPVEEVALEVMALNTPDEIDVRFDRIAVWAEQIVRTSARDAGRDTLVRLIALHVVAVGVGLAVLRRRTARAAMGVPDPC